MLAWKPTVVGACCEFAEEVGGAAKMMTTKKERGFAAIFTVLVGLLELENSEKLLQI